jgi:hypothetical protein
MRVRGHELSEAVHLQHFACFACRKAFKQTESGHPSTGETLRPFPCSCCKAEMVPLGRDFKAPSVRSKLQWLKVELLHSFGVTFEVPVADGGGPGVRPATLGRAIDYLVSKGCDRIEVERRLNEIRRVRLG